MRENWKQFSVAQVGDFTRVGAMPTARRGHVTDNHAHGHSKQWPWHPRQYVHTIEWSPSSRLCLGLGDFVNRLRRTRRTNSERQPHQRNIIRFDITFLRL